MDNTHNAPNILSPSCVEVMLVPATEDTPSTIDHPSPEGRPEMYLVLLGGQGTLITRAEFHDYVAKGARVVPYDGRVPPGKKV